MALDFPASPITGVTYTGPNGVIWVWDGAKWVNGTTIGTAYAPIQSPVFTGNPTAPNPPSGDADTSVATTAFVAAAVAPALNGVGRNLLHNPLFNVAQRGAGPFAAQGYTLDRWYISVALDTVSVFSTANNDAGRAAIGDEQAAVMLVNSFTGNAGAGAYNFLVQRIEGVRRLAGKTITLSFWAIAQTGTPKMGINMLQSFGTGGSPSAALRVLPTGNSVTPTASWARYSTTITVPSASGKTLGTAGDDYTAIELWYSSGATNNPSAGNIGVQSGQINLWGVQLEVGSVATPLEKPDPRYDLANCQRFYTVLNTVSFASYISAGGQTFIGSWTLPVRMRTTPTAAFSNQAYGNASGVTANGATPSAIGAYATAGTVGQANAYTDIALSADL